MTGMAQEQAQRRIEQMSAFNQELALLEREQVLTLSTEQRHRLADYQRGVREHYRIALDVDVEQASAQLSWGMRIASLLGAVALAAALFFLLGQFWRDLTLHVQVAILIAAPLLSLALTAWLQVHERSGYYARLMALLALTCFVLNIKLLGQLFNITPSSNALLAWSVLALLLAYGCSSRLLLVLGLGFAGVFIVDHVSGWAGLERWELFEAPELWMPLGVLLWVAQWPIQRRYYGFARCYRVLGLLCILLPVLFLSVESSSSFLPWSKTSIELFYQLAGLFLCALGLYWGVRKSLPEVVWLSLGFGLVLMLIKAYDWFWDWLPTWAFFLLIGLAALLVLMVLMRLRRHTQGRVL